MQAGGEARDTADLKICGKKRCENARQGSTLWFEDNYMGSFYTNYTLRGVSQQAVVSAMEGRSAIVTQEQDGFVVVYDEVSDDQDEQIIAALAEQLSSELNCTVLAVLNHDDDILWYQLYLRGELADEYNSTPEYFDPEAGPSSPQGGDAQKLCDAFGSSNVEEVESILRKSGMDEDGYVFAVQRHTDLARTLGLPPFSVAVGFRHLSRGKLPKGLDEDGLVRL
jgi:hypothetical protein